MKDEFKKEIRQFILIIKELKFELPFDVLYDIENHIFVRQEDWISKEVWIKELIFSKEFKHKFLKFKFKKLIKKEICTCDCHTHPAIMHMMPCCDSNSLAPGYCDITPTSKELNACYEALLEDKNLDSPIEFLFKEVINW